MIPSRTMKQALKDLAAGRQPRTGRPTKQRLAKYGFATYIEQSEHERLWGILNRWDRPMEITEAGLRAIGLPKEIVVT